MNKFRVIFAEKKGHKANVCFSRTKVLNGINRLQIDRRLQPTRNFNQWNPQQMFRNSYRPDFSRFSNFQQNRFNKPFLNRYNIPPQNRIFQSNGT